MSTPQGGADEPTSSSGDKARVGQRTSGSRSADGDERDGQRMGDGAMARTTQGGDLAARKARALRGATAGLAAGSAAGATAGRGGQGSGGTATRSTPGSTARTTNPRSRSPRPAQRRGGPRRVRLTAQRIDPWSVLKISFLVSVALGISTVVMVGVLWTVLSGLNVFSTLNDFITQVTSGETGGPQINLLDFLGFGRVVALSAVLGVLNVFLLTALATLTAFLYNICAALVGGAQVTLSDD